jgi:polysaccharide export outer membrane protein
LQVFKGEMQNMKRILCRAVPVRFLVTLASVVLLFVAAGCRTPIFADLDSAARASESLVLNEGDTLQISFPGAPNLNTTQKIRRDGRITLPVVGEFTAAGLTPSEMEKKLLELYANELVQKEVAVTVESSSFPVFVTGAVLRPGKVVTDRPISALEAVMEAGGFDYSKANLKSVTVIRQENGQVKHFYVNLKAIMNGHQGDTFSLKPLDILYVPERFTWF